MIDTYRNKKNINPYTFIFIAPLTVQNINQTMKQKCYKYNYKKKFKNSKYLIK